MLDTGEITASLGTTLRRVRSSAGLTLEVAARQAGVSKGYLSKVESGQAQPSSKVMVRLDEVFGITLSDILMPDKQRRPISVVRANERMPIIKSGSDIGYGYELASKAKLNPRAEVFFLNVPILAGDDAPRFKHAGEEIILVLEGQMRFEYGGVDFVLKEGDCVQFDAGIEHYSFAEGKKPARLFVVNIPDWLERKR